MSRLNGPVLGILTVLCSAMPMAACEDDPDDLNYLKAGSGGNAAAAGKAGSGCKCGVDCKCGIAGSGGAGSGSAGKAGASSDADAG